MMPGHGDVELMSNEPQIPRAVQARLECRSAAETVFPVLRPRAGDGFDFPCLEIEGAEAMVLAICHIEYVALEGKSLRVVELRLGDRAVRLAGRAAARNGDLPAVEIRN